MKPGYIAGPVLKTFPRIERLRALPPESPMAMPRQSVDGIRCRSRARGSLIASFGTGVARILLVVGTIGLTAYGVLEMYRVMSSIGLTPLQWLFLVLFTVNFAWVSFSACQAALGFLHRTVRDLLPRWRRRIPSPTFRTAILAPVYNEDPQAVAAGLAVMAEGLARRAPGGFDIFILSDSNRPGAWIAEESVFAKLVAEADSTCKIYYRHRRFNTERKAGNIAEWVKRWGGGYDAMLVLDADSLMASETIVEMAGRLESDPGLGLLQTLPAIVRARSVYARLQQFANRCYGPIFGNGLATWHGRSSNFWGHNAIIRTEAFAASASLPLLRGNPPFGGSVLSHDFIEAALLRRAGWGVRLDTDLYGSFEEAPPSLLDVSVRDRRWCQGNLQHSRFLFAKGLCLPTRLHLLVGIMAYVSAPLWFALVFIGLVIAVQAAVTNPIYFTGPSLFPAWPVFDSARAISLFFVSMAIVLSPKALGWLSVMLNPRRLICFGGPFALTASVLTEVALSALYAPVMMITQSRIVLDVLRGGDSGWTPQRRGDGRIGLRDALRAHRLPVAAGLGLSALAYLLNPDLFLWLLPVTLGLLLAPILSCVSGSFRLGRILSWFAILRTPEERRAHRPSILTKYKRALDRYPTHAAAPLEVLQMETNLRRWHVAQLEKNEGPAFEASLILARAKYERATDLQALQAWLTDDELMSFLHDPNLVASLDQSRVTEAVS